MFLLYILRERELIKKDRKVERERVSQRKVGWLLARVRRGNDRQTHMRTSNEFIDPTF